VLQALVPESCNGGFCKIRRLPGICWAFWKVVWTMSGNQLANYPISLGRRRDEIVDAQLDLHSSNKPNAKRI
jgi:hypothetical protein